MTAETPAFIEYIDRKRKEQKCLKPTPALAVPGHGRHDPTPSSTATSP